MGRKVDKKLDADTKTKKRGKKKRVGGPKGHHRSVLGFARRSLATTASWW